MAARDGLWKDEDVQQVIQYVISRQGEPMEVYLEDGLYEYRSFTVTAR
jgi:hypothetical protein